MYSFSQNLEHQDFSAKDLGVKQSENTFKLQLPNYNKEIKEIINNVNYTQQLFNDESETKFINENKSKIWFWNNVIFVFGIGTIFEDSDHEIFNQIMLYFDKKRDCYFPNKYLVENYKNSKIIESIEDQFNYSRGNYHLIFSLVVNSNKDLDNASESLFSNYGPVFCSTDYQEIVDIIIEMFSKYGAVQNLFNTSQISTFGVSRDISKGGQNGLPREMLRDEGVRRTYRQGFLDLNANDGYEEVNPNILENPNSVNRFWFSEDNESQIYRKPNKNKTQLKELKRPHGQQSLYNQIHSKTPIVDNKRLNNEKAIQFKMDFYKETVQNTINKPSIEMYEIDNYENLSNTDKFIENATSRNKTVVCPHINLSE